MSSRRPDSPHTFNRDKSNSAKEDLQGQNGVYVSREFDHTYKRILIPTDFSANSEVALRYGVGLSEFLGASLTLVHSYRLIEKLGSRPKSALTLRDEWSSNAQKHFTELESKVLSGCRVPYTFQAEVGFPADAILDVADFLDPDLIVMGLSDTSHFNLLFGSTILRVIDEARCPIMVVPPNVTYHDIQRITFAVELNDHRLQSPTLTPFVQFAKRFNAHVEVVNVLMKDQTRVNMKSESLEPFDSMLTSIGHTYKFIKGDDVVDDTLTHLVESQSDILVTIRKEHSFLEKLYQQDHTGKFLHQSSLPVMIIKD